MERIFFLICVIFCANVSICTKEIPPTCESWHTVYQVLKSRSENQINCVEQETCTGLSCNGTHESFDYSVGFTINGCKDPLTLDIFCDVPKLELHKFKHTFKNGDKLKLTGVHLNSANFDLYLEVVLIKEGQHVLLTILLKPEISSLETVLRTYPLLVNQTIELPGCEKMALPPMSESTTAPKNVAHEYHDITSFQVKQIQDARNSTGKPCQINLLEDCGENEICKQISGQNGTCFCIDQYHLNKNNNCVLNNSEETSTKPNFAVIFGTTIPVCLLLLCSACFLVIYKFGLVQKVRDYRSSNRTYEVLDIGAENEDDDVPMVV